jgi:rubrerythrin
MTLEAAIKTALEFERKIQSLYMVAARSVADPTAKKVFATLGREEQGHIDYLESRLTEWQRDGHIQPERLVSILPSPARIAEGIKRVRATVGKSTGIHDAELASLNQALAAEEETSAFYARMVRELSGTGQTLFARFLEIEAGHTALVRAQIDNVIRNGSWLDLKEFDLELD